MAKIKSGGVDVKKRKMKTFSTLPKFYYLMQVVDSDFQENNDEDGYNITLQWEVMKGEYKGRKFYDNLPIVCSKSEQAEEIAKDKWAAIHQALGLSKEVKDTKDLHKKPVVVQLGIRTNKKTKEEQNNSIGYYPAEQFKELTKGSSEEKETKKGKKEKKPWEGEEKKKKDKKKKKK